MNDILEVYETDADFSMESANLKHQGANRDIAESKMLRLFSAAEYKKDFLLYNRTRQTVCCECLSARTRALRGECQG